MEAIFFAIDVIGILLVLYWSIQNDDRRAGSPTTGLFAFHETVRHRRALKAGGITAAENHSDATNHRRPPSVKR